MLECMAKSGEHWVSACGGGALGVSLWKFGSCGHEMKGQK